MKKSIMIIETIFLSMLASFMVMAGTWKHDSTGWWYDYGNGTYPASSWQWIDGNNDGIAECYYFNQYGYMAENTFQDGYQINANGQWVANDVIQTKNVGNVSNTRKNQTKQTQSHSEKSSNNDTSKETVLNLMEAEPLRLYHNARTSEDELWKECYILDGFEYITFTLNGNYSELSFKYAPSYKLYKNRHHIISVLGDDDSILWESEEITFDSTAQNATVDVSGQNEIRIYVKDDSWAGGILFKDMYAE